MLAAGLTLAALAISVPLVLGFLKHLHPAFDSLAHFRAHLAALLIPTALPLLFCRMVAQGLLAIVLGAATLGTVLDPAVLFGGKAEASAPFDARYRLLHLNLRYDNRNPKAVLSVIGRVQADVITLNEVSSLWRRELAFIEAAYPYRLICSEPTPIGGVAILSRRPFLHPSRAECFDRGAVAVATVNFGGTAVDIAAVHLGWPWPFEQPAQVERVAPILKQLGTTAILAGDLNAVPWSAAAEQLAGAGELAILRDIGPTWLLRPLPDALRRLAGLPIDNVFLKGGIAAPETRRLDSVGSDHLPVLVEFGIASRATEGEVLQALVPGGPALR
jgi:endonuclease/exonuclease/phosphatase (EEP) superfamily protein YafD